VENAGFKTQIKQPTEVQTKRIISKLVADKLRTSVFPSIFAEMTLEFKNVRLKNGSKDLPENERLQQDWYIEYYILEHDRWKRYKYRHDLNRVNKFKTYNEKLHYGNILLEIVEDLLSKGTPPHLIKTDTSLLNGVVKFTVTEKIPAYLAHKTSIGTRPKSISSYSSKLNFFELKFGQTPVSDLTSESIEKWLHQIAENKSWTNTTYNQTRIILYNFFEYLISFGNLENNPIQKVRTRKKVTSSEAHKPFSQELFKNILDYLDKNDETTALFARMIYHTCARPKEIRQLKVGNFDLDKKTLFIPETISKNKRASYLLLNDDIINHLKKHGIKDEPKTKFIFAARGKLFGDSQIGENTIYERFISALKNLKLDNSGYTLYSVKHTSNIIRYQNGWTVAQIMKANRHASITETENYLRRLGEFIEMNQSIPNL
jgi:integrase